MPGMTKKQPTPKPVSPASAGNAGAHFEAPVGAYYFLTMIAGGEPRGLPGTTIKTVALQQRMSEHPLDDVVVHAVDGNGSPATLEIQAKRSMSFTASDTEFADVVSQIWAATQKPEFRSTRYELAVAISRTTTRLEEAIQDVLHWARVHDNAADFHADIQREGFASKPMRNFVAVFSDKLKACGGSEDDETVWRLLRSFQVLVFDFEAEGSTYEHYARERCRMVLVPGQANRAGDLWNKLIVKAGAVARAAGTLSRQQLVESFAAESGYQFAAERSHQVAFDRLAEEAHLALKDVDDQIGGARLSRSELVATGSKALNASQILNVTGAPGSGKTMVLKRFVELSENEGRVVVLRGGRIVGGGWLSLANALGTTSSASDFFTDLASAGGATLFVDNIDQVDDVRERQTIADLLDVGANYPGWRVVVTTSSDGNDWTSLLPRSLQGQIARLEVPPISDDEAVLLSEQNSTIAGLLRPDHPAKGIARNLFYLARLVNAGIAEANSVSMETDLARLWWAYGGGRNADDGRFARLKAMRKMGAEVLAHPGRPATKTDDLESGIVPELLRLDAIREEVPGAEVAFRHDVLRDWTIGLMITDNPQILRDLPKQLPASASVVRGLELAARLALDADPTGVKWRGLLRDTTGSEAHGSWRRPILLALPRSERAGAYFDALEPVLLADEGSLLGELVRLLLVVDSVPVGNVLRQFLPDLKIPAGAGDFVYPKGASWPPTIMWLARHGANLPGPVILDVAKAYMAWLMVTSGFGMNLPVNADVVAILFGWLETLDEEARPLSFRAGEELPKLLNVPHHKDTQEYVRMAAFSFAQVNVEAARRYTTNLGQADVRHREFESIIRGRGALAKAAPGEFADYFMAGIVDPEDDGDPYSPHRDHSPFGYHEHIFLAPGPGQGPMLELLQHAPSEGLRLVRRIVEHATNWQRKRYRRSNATFPRFAVPLESGEQFFEGDEQIYRFARSSVPSSITTSALMALEAWSHQRIEAGDDPATVLREILGPDGSSVAFLAVAVDVILSHWPKFVDIGWPFVATPHVMKLDEDRHTRDLVGLDDFSLFPDREGSDGPSRAQLKGRPSRRLRLMDLLPRYVLHRREDVGPKVRAALEKAKSLIPAPQPDEGADPLTGLYAVAQRLARMADPANWQDVVGQREDGTEVALLQYVPEVAEQQLIEERSIEVNASTRRAESMASIKLAFSDAAHATPQVVSDGIAWAQAEQPFPADVDEGEEFEAAQAKRTVVMAAVLAVRHASGEKRQAAVEWAKTVFTAIIQVPEDEPYYQSPHIEYDAKAIAAAGMVQLYSQMPEPVLRREILELAASPYASVANAIAIGFPSLRVNDQPFLRSILRTFIMTANYVRDRHDGNADKRRTGHANAVKRSIEAELSWLDKVGAEPAWPAVVPWQIRARRHTRIPGPGAEIERPLKTRQPPELYADETRLGLISSHLVSLAVGERPDWLIDLTQHLLNWAVEANGPDEDNHDADGRPFTFNASFFDYLGILFAALPSDDAARMIEPLMGLPSVAFVDVAATLLRGFDRAVNSTDATKPSDLFALRRLLGPRIQETDGYRRLEWQKSFSCEMHLGDAFCAMFYQGRRGFSLGLPRLPRPPSSFAAVMPALTSLVVGAPTSGYLAVLFLELIELAPIGELSPHVVDATAAWSTTYGDDTSFWSNDDIGARVCAWFTKVIESSDLGLTNAHQERLRGTLDVMVRSGVTSARLLEELIETINNHSSVNPRSAN